MPVVELAAHGGPEVLVPATRLVPVPAADQLLVRVGACGVCGHDALARRGLLAAPVGSVLGHEIAGRVEAAGADVTGWVGRRVALVQRIPCGACAECAAGTTARCRQGPGFYGEDLPGGYAEFVLASPLNAVPLPDEVDDVTGALLSCAVGTGLKALHTAGVRAGDVVVVTGAGGGVGVHTVQVAHHLGAVVVAVTGDAAKVQALREAGADEVAVRPDGRALRAIAARLDRPRGVDVVVETTGAPTFATALRSLRPGGRLVLVGNTVPGELPLDPGLVIVRELAVLGSAHATRADLVEVVELVRRGVVRPLAARVWPLAEAAAAHAALDARSLVGRAVLRP
ncbi:NADPH:quinone reductase [Geodermatophilus sp. Leaf369]|uniref:alcohol dehydrogenase catalytic domain-containing protein n=1 Tax=Geodermatophilus sp. Leaf369 TaxID=1736354 RepID=UPI0007010C2C|nr:zinc-binding dehydrogenase [Geodermatophilus sp. Leaf369]KQS54584.1 NADPH:quinone reductase [Geodermatophilus sp. Leaf369]